MKPTNHLTHLNSYHFGSLYMQPIITAAIISVHYKIGASKTHRHDGFYDGDTPQEKHQRLSEGASKALVHYTNAKGGFAICRHCLPCSTHQRVLQIKVSQYYLLDANRALTFVYLMQRYSNHDRAHRASQNNDSGHSRHFQFQVAVTGLLERMRTCRVR